MSLSDVSTPRRRRPAPPGEPSATVLSIGQFSRRSRLSLKALRLYDRLGVLRPADVDARTGYRRYREDQLPAARLVAMLRRLDMPLPDVLAVLAAPGGEAAALVSAWWEDVERRRAYHRELAEHLVSRLSEVDQPVAFAVDSRHVPEMTVLSESRRLTVDDLPGWLQPARERGAELAERCGGMTAPQYVVFHGEVTHDSDGPVDPLAAATAGQPTRVEAAHVESFVRLRKAQVQYPQILSAFDAVGEHVRREGRRVTGSPREIYFADVASAAPSDLVCDVALPHD